MPSCTEKCSSEDMQFNTAVALNVYDVHMTLLHLIPTSCTRLISPMVYLITYKLTTAHSQNSSALTDGCVHATARATFP